MSNFDITKKNTYKESFRSNKIVGMFDIHENNFIQSFKGNIDLPNEWNIGLIVGRSGTGKSTIAREMFGLYQTEYSNKPIIDEMPDNKTVEEITEIFSLVGLSSPPHWLKQYSMLSNGEKMRCDLAKAILDDKEMIVFDEFTSVVDRDVAKIVSIAISKAIKKKNKKFIAVTCHYDVMDWLEPDWVFSTDEMKMLEVKKNDQISQLIYTKGIQNNGQFLKNIII